MKKALSIAIMLGAAATVSAAAADETTAPAAKKGETTVPTVFIHGKPMRPNASITVARVPLEVTLAALKKPLADRIAKPAEKDPF